MHEERQRDLGHLGGVYQLVSEECILEDKNVEL